MIEDLKCQVVQQVNHLRGEKKFSAQVHGRVSQVLRAFRSPSECHEIAEDAIGEVILKLMVRLDTMDHEQLASFKTIEDVRAYLLRGVQNYALDRYRRWHGGVSKVGSEFHNGVQRSESAGSTEVRQGARARYEADDIVELIDTITPLDDNMPFEIDLQRLDDLLHQRGISQEEITIIKARLNGFSYQELANDQGGTADKYRKIVRRALDRSGLELDV